MQEVAISGWYESMERRSHVDEELWGTRRRSRLAALYTQDGGFLIGGESGSINHSANPEVRHHGGLDSWVAKLDALAA